jgi:hypothetical protein
MIDAIPLLLAPEGYQISRSVRLRSSASAYFNRTPASAGNRKTWTWSGWVKRGSLGAQRNLFTGYIGSGAVDTSYFTITYNGSDKLAITGYSTIYRLTTAVYRDPSAWYHIAVAVDTTQATAANRFRLYVNGVEVTAFDTSNNPAQNTDLGINQASPHYLGWDAFTTYFDGYLTEVNFIDGQALTPSSFGETDAATGVWQPKKYAGTYGTNGFYLNFSDNSNNTATTIGRDYSGNGNNWTPNNISVTAGVTYDSMLDVPTQWADGGNGRGNYAVLNPITGGSSTTSDGNLAATLAPVNGARVSTIAVTSGKWYCEMVPTTINGYFVVGIGASYSKGWDTTQESNANSITWASTGAGSPSIQAKGSWTFSSNTVTTSYVVNDVIGIALDLDSNTLAFYKNGVSQGSTTINTQGIPVSFLIGNSSGASNGAGYVNFGQRPFAYTPPTGFKALNTLNLPTPTILKGNQYMDATLYTGTGAARSVVNAGGFQPDLVWMKNRTVVANNTLMDSQRSLNALYSDLTSAENTPGNALTSFNADGFSVGNSAAVNGSGNAIVGWQWKEGPTQGFDIVTFTSDGSTLQTVAHSLGVSPDMIIVKPRSAVGSWGTYHKNLTSTNFYLNLNSTAAQTNGGAQMWGVSSSNFQLRSSSFIGANGVTAVAYLFSEVAGFSRFGSYTGNGSTDGPFCFTGFLPRYVMIKRTDAVGNWNIYDTARNDSNVANRLLLANTSDAEVAGGGVLDINSNGFKLRDSSANWNASAGSYIFMAFASNPFKHSLAR